MKKMKTCVLGCLALILLTVTAAFAETYYFGFEADADNYTNDWFGSIASAPTGKDGIVSSEGQWHGEVYGHSYSSFDKIRDQWTGSWTSEIDVFLDPAWPSGSGFDYTVGAENADLQTHQAQRQFVFHVAKDATTGTLLIAGDTNLVVHTGPREDLENLDNYEIGSAGWYTLQHVFYEENGVLVVDMNLLNLDGEVLFTLTSSNPADTIPDEVGGNSYAIFTNVNVPSYVAVDAFELAVVVAAPTHKDECKNDGWMTFTNPEFKNQGDCVSFVASGK